MKAIAKFIRSFFEPWEYGTFREDGSGAARRHRRTKEVQFLLWTPGQQGHVNGYWHRVGDGWEDTFKPGAKS